MRPAAMALLLAAGVITLAGTAGCAGSPGADTGGTTLPPLTPPGTTAPPSVNPSPSLSVPPPARQHTVKGAEAFVRYYFTLLDYAFVTGDVGPYLAASAEDCESCQYQAKVLREHYRNGKSYQGGEFTLLSVASTATTPRAPVPVVVSLSRAPLKELSPSGEVVSTLSPKGSGTYRFLLVWKEARWLVGSYSFLGTETSIDG